MHAEASLQSILPPAVILVEPTQEGNIGSTARAMANFGLKDLRLVRPQADPNSLFCRQMASGANAVLDAVTIFETTEAAVADLEKVYALSARQRGMIKTILSAHHCAVECGALSTQATSVGWLFGTEKWGLTNEDMALADAIVTISLSPDHTSLNLAQAVVVMAYEWFQATCTYPQQDSFLRKGKTTFATKTDLGHLFDHLESELDNANFWRTPEKKPIMVQTLRNIFLRCGLTHQEVQTLRGMIQALVYYRWKKPTPIPNLVKEGDSL